MHSVILILYIYRYQYFIISILSQSQLKKNIQKPKTVVECTMDDSNSTSMIAQNEHISTGIMRKPKG